jgi:phospholipase C
MRHLQPRPAVLALLAMLAADGCGAPTSLQSAPPASMQRIGHVVVIYAENHSFDNLYGLFPGADGVANATPEQMTQLDHDGQPLKELIVFGDGRAMKFSARPVAPNG